MLDVTWLRHLFIQAFLALLNIAGKARLIYVLFNTLEIINLRTIAITVKNLADKLKLSFIPF